MQRTANPKIDAAKTPETYVNDVRTNVELLSNVYLQALKTEVLSCSADWLASYFAAGGLESLATIMIHAIGSDKLTHLNTCLEIVTGLISSPEDLNRVGAVPDLGEYNCSCCREYQYVGCFVGHKMHGCARLFCIVQIEAWDHHGTRYCWFQLFVVSSERAPAVLSLGAVHSN